ncbi:MAG: leucine-rich repeat domain-containing protein, partial [Treponema sp.]|nr:leucine-rich repeat domain-containing protein [Treponema sp.]
MALFLAVLGVFALFTACDQPVDNDKSSLTIDQLDLSGLVAAPGIGNTPDTAITTAQYTGTIAWKDSSGAVHTGAFAASTVYTAHITLTAKSGYTFLGIAAGSFTYSGAAVSQSAGSGTSLTLTITFPATAGSFVPVTSILGVPSSAIVGTALTLTGTVEPADATNKTIRWSVKTDGNTAGGTITGTNTLNTTQAGSVTVIAAIVNGTSGGTAFTTEFTIMVTTSIIKNTADLAAYLAAESGGKSANSPIPVAMDLALTETNWKDILDILDSGGKYVFLDLSACKKSGSGGGGLRASGDFDPISDIDTGKGNIVNLTLPTLATGIVDGPSQNSGDQYTFKYFIALKTVSGAEVRSIGFSAFSGCTALTSVSFPKATAIGNKAFSGCTALTSISFPK